MKCGLVGANRMELSQLSPRRPYLLRAFYEWMLDNQLTPHLVVDVTSPGVYVPMEYARDDQIILNIAPHAVRNLQLDNEEVRFDARFGGVPRQVTVPLAAVRALYARENDAGIMFEPEAAYGDVLSDLIDPENNDIGTVISMITSNKSDGAGDDGPDNDPPRRGGRRPVLRVVK